MEIGTVVLQKHRSLISLRIQVEMHSRVASGALEKPAVRKLPFNIAALRARSGKTL